MLKLISSISQLNCEQLMAVYREGNIERGKWISPDAGVEEQCRSAETAFLEYLREDFFVQKGRLYCVWEAEDAYQAALRLEPYRDGLLLEALETAPNARRNGYAYSLMTAVLDYLRATDCRVLYSHVSKRNVPSLAVHNKCGFYIISNSATYVDGTVTQNSYTLCYDIEKL